MKLKWLFILLILPAALTAQHTISLQSAIDSALKNNFGIQIARNQAEINRISNTFGNAGGLPTISASAGDVESLNNINQKLSNGTITERNNAGGNSFSAGITAGITLFNGFKVLSTKSRLAELEQQGIVLLNRQIQNTMAAVMVKYYDILRQQSYLRIVESSRELSAQKLRIIEEKGKIGMASAADLLQAQMDLNAAEQNVTAQQMMVDQSKTDLMELMASTSFDLFIIKDSIVPDKTMVLDSIMSGLQRNPDYLSASSQVRISELLVREVSAQRYPTVKINTSYNFARTQNDAGFTLLNQSYGPSAGITLQIPIFNGTTYLTQRQVAKINVINAELDRADLMHALTAGATRAFRTYSTTLQQISEQEKNFHLAKKLVNVVMQNFTLSEATILDVKAAQTSYESAAYLLENLRFTAKAAEIELKQMTFSLP